MTVGRAIMVVALAIGAASCGENAAEKANRTALTPLLHRDRALTQEYLRTIDNEGVGTMTYGQVFEQYDKFKSAKESLQAEIRKIVPTPQYDCILGLASRSIDADISLINARESYFHHQLAYNAASKLANEYLSEARGSEYGGAVLLRDAQEQIDDMRSESDQMAQFRKGSRHSAESAAFIADSLTTAVLQLRLLPSMERPRYPIITDSGPDSLTQLRIQPPVKVCVGRG